MCINSGTTLFKLQYNSTNPEAGYLERQLSAWNWLFGKICREFYKSSIPWNYRLSDQVQHGVIASRTSNQACSKRLDAVLYCTVLYKVTAELQSANVAYFQTKIQLSGVSAYPDFSPSQLVRISGVLLHVKLQLQVKMLLICYKMKKFLGLQQMLSKFRKHLCMPRQSSCNSIILLLQSQKRAQQLCIHPWWYKQLQQTQGYIREEEGKFLR